jgi:basic amino acid/polyamine antiporter, APA family
MNPDETLRPDPTSNTLPRVLGPLAAFAFVIGSVIGSGIFVKPATIAAEVGDFRWIVFVWVAVGAVTLFGALTVAELASLFPHAGGPYVYLREAFGKLPAFLWGWTEFLIIRTASIGALVTACVIYFSQVVPLTYFQQEATACVLIVVLAAVACVSTRGSAGVQIFTVSAKSLLILLIVLLPIVSGVASTSNLQTTAVPKTGSLFAGLGAALLAVWWTYDGWINLGPLAEDVRDPQRNLARAMFWGVATIVALYLSATLAYHLVMPMTVLGASKAPAADALALAYGDGMRTLVAAGVAISTLGTASASLTIGPRVIFAMSRDRLLPLPLSRIHSRFQTPIFAIITQAFWALLLIHYCFANAPVHEGVQNPRDAFDSLTDIAIFGGSIFYAMAVAAVFRFRVTHPELPRPYRTWGYPVTPAVTLIAFAAVIYTLFEKRPTESLIGLGLMAVGGVYYFIWNRGPSTTTRPS